MLIYVLDSNYQESMVIDTYQSFIWTERFGSPGDFTLILDDNADVRGALVRGTWLVIRESKRVMIVEEILEDRDDSGVSTLTYKGPSIESLLAGRVGHSSDISSWKSRMYNLTEKTVIDGFHDDKDIIPLLNHGTNKLYPNSTIDPSTDQLPFSMVGWQNLGELHEEAADQFPIGYRIVRDLNDPQKRLYYDTYTGVNRTRQGGKFEPTLKWTFPNPYMLEAGESVIVWENLASNAGFTEDLRPLASDPVRFAPRRSTNKVVDSDTSISGKAMAIIPDKDAPDTESSSSLNGYKGIVTSDYEGAPWKGRTFTLSVTGYIPRSHSGTRHVDSLRILVSTWTPNETRLARSAAIPNVHRGTARLSLTFTIPTNESHSFSIRLMNGSMREQDEVHWSDLLFTESTKQGIGYFDSTYSPDEDLVPAQKYENIPNGPSVLQGSLIAGQEGTWNGVLIQSKTWKGQPGVSARLIHNSDKSVAKPWASLNVEQGTRHVEVESYQSKVLAGTDSKLGTMTIGGISTTPTAKSNTAGSSKVMTSTSTVGNYHITLHGGFHDIGESMYFNNLYASLKTNGEVKMDLRPLTFTEKNDDFISSQTYMSYKDYKNVAYVVHTIQRMRVEVDEEYGTIPGRRVILVDASEVELKGAALRKELELIGKKTLLDHRETFLLDGVVTAYCRHEYDVDYYLGDVVLVGNHRGQLFPMQVTEYIFVSDGEGIRSYPTFSDQTAITGGVWHSAEYNVFWDDVLGEWAEQP